MPESTQLYVSTINNLDDGDASLSNQHTTYKTVALAKKLLIGRCCGVKLTN